VVNVAEQAIAAAHRALRTLDQDDAEHTSRTQLVIAAVEAFAADAHLRLGEPRESLRVLGSYEEEQARTANWPENIIAERMRIRIDALEIQGHSSEADRLLRDLGTHAPERAIPVIHRIIRSVYDDVIDSERRGLADEARDASLKRLRPLAALVASIVEDASRSGATQVSDQERRAIQFHLAESHRLAQKYEDGLQVFASLRAESPDSLEFAVGWAECSFHLGHDEDAMREFRRIHEHVQHRQNWMFWLAELRMLEILDRLGRNTIKIFPRVQRLRRIDPHLGGVRFSRDLAAIEARHAP
jgi:hypothetical protein